MPNPAVNLILRSQRDPTLFKYKSGDSISALGGTFSRTSTATYIDASGVIQTAASGTIRDGHYIGGNRTTLLEGQRTNLLLQSNGVGAPWSGAPTITANNVAAPDGNTAATRVVFPSADQDYRQVISGGTTGTVLSGWVKGTAGQTIMVGFVGGTTNNRTFTGGWDYFSVARASGTDPFMGTYGGVTARTFWIWGWQVEVGTAASSHIPTTAATVTRAADSLSFPFTHPPQEMSVYARLVDLGSGTTASGARVAHIGGAASSTTPRFSLNRSSILSDGYTQTYHNTANESAASTVQPATGATVELVGTLTSAAAPMILVSVNGGATTTVTGATQPMASAWSQSILNIGSFAGTESHFGAYRNLIIAKGTRDMAFFRSRA